MMAFGRDQLLKKDEVDNVVAYVLSLSDSRRRQGRVRGEARRRQAVFTANCVTCHGDDAKGKTDLGGPDLTDRSWIYGGDAESISMTVWGGRQGQMPSWEGSSRRSIARFWRSIFSIFVGAAMSDASAATGKSGQGPLFWAAVGAGLLLVLIANSHLVYMQSYRNGVRCACSPGRRQPEGRKIQRGKVVMHTTMRMQGDQR